MDGTSQDLLKHFILRNKPHVITVSAESREALMMVEDVRTITAQLAEDGKCPPINFELVDNSVAKIIAKSTRVKTQFPENRLLRKAIIIARMLQVNLSSAAFGIQ
jgi:transcription elongation factor SPT6